MYFSLTTLHIGIRENKNATRNVAIFKFKDAINESTKPNYRREWVRIELIDFINRYEFDINKDLDIIENYFEIAQNDSLKLKL